MKKNILYLLILIFMVSFCVPSFSQGWEWDDADQTMYDNMERIETNTRAILPPNSSMSRYLPYVHHQGQTGMCVAYALASARTILYARNKNMYDQKEISRASFSPYFIYYHGKRDDDNDCMKGISPFMGLYLLDSFGVPKIMDVECPDYYPCTNQMLCNYYPPDWSQDVTNASLYKIDNYYALTTLNDIKSAILSGNPCLYGIKTVPSFKYNMDGKDMWSPDADESVEDSEAIHALVVISYDDTKYGGAFQVLNSWGYAWGNQGTAWIQYDDFFEFAVASFSIHRRYESSRYTTRTPDINNINIPDSSGYNFTTPSSIINIDIESQYKNLLDE